MATEYPLTDGVFLMQRFPGKGGWTFVAIPGIAQNPNNPFGWVPVKGNIDGYPLKQYKLMPMGEGRLFLPVKADIRKKIGKEAGDYVQVTLYADNTAFEMPEEIQQCFDQEDPQLLQIFLGLRESEQQAYVNWIYAARREETKVNRILQMMEKLGSMK